VSSTQDDDDALMVDRRRKPGTIPPHLVERMVSNSENLITEALELRLAIVSAQKDINRVDSEVQADRRIWIGLIVLLMLVLGGLSTIAVMNRGTNTATRQLAEQINSCLDPKGECAQRSAERQRELLGEPSGPINQVAVAAASCAVDLARDESLRGDILTHAVDACVRASLKE
jgi:hypothetical protein